MERCVKVDTTICKQLEEIYPAYALSAVDGKDRAQIEQHIAVCPACANIVAGYRPVADNLAYAVPLVEPPADLKYRVLAAALPHTSPAPSLLAQLSHFITQLFRAPAFSAIALVLVVALGAWNLSLQNQLEEQAAITRKILDDMNRQRALVSTIAYADTQPKRMQATEIAPQAIGRLYLAPELNTLALIVYDLPPLEPSRTYQVWLIDSAGERTSGGTFTVDERGRGWVYIRSPKPLNQCNDIGITIEPAGGSPQPTTPRVLGASL
jgi:anti-sigma-K factor RskA